MSLSSIIHIIAQIYSQIKSTYCTKNILKDCEYGQWTYS